MDEPAPSPAAALADVRASASSADGLVTVTVDGAGRVVDLDLDATAMRKQSSDLAALLLATIGQAQDAAREQARQRLDELAPPLPPATELTDTLQALHETATGRLAEMSAALTALVERTTGGSR